MILNPGIKFLPNEYVFGNDMGFAEKDEAIALAIVTYVPSISLWLPRALGMMK